MNFTLRDSRVDFINVSCWGKSAYIHDLSDHFHIGDVGKSFMTLYTMWGVTFVKTISLQYCAQFAGWNFKLQLTCLF